MRAMILAAGLGTRLRPLTNNKPKALVEVNNMPLLEIAIRRLKYFGVKDIVINVHHFANQIISFLVQKNNFDINILVSDEQEQLMNTGGGLKKAAHFFSDNQPFLLTNTDILSNINLKKMYDNHLESEALVTLAVRSRDTSRYLLFDEQAILHGWVNTKSKEMIVSRQGGKSLTLKAFSGFHIIDPVIFNKMPEDIPFSIIDTYLEAAKKLDIVAYPHDKDFWLDVGKLPALEQAENLAKMLTII